MTERILRNIGSGLIAQVWSGLLGIIVLPIVVRGLGAERYGLLALSLALVGFAAIADLGVGRAASKYLAEDFERNEMSRTEQHMGTALTICCVMGLLGTCFLAAITPFLVDDILKIPVALSREARVVLWLTSLGLLPVLLRISFDGALAGHHRIAELSISNMLANTLKAGLSIWAVVSGRSIVGVVAANLVVSCMHAVGLWIYARHYFYGRVKIQFSWQRQVARDLVRLGLMSSTASFLAGILLLYFDRFVIALFLPLSALGYYSTGFDITSKQCYISNPIGQAFFPVFSGKSTAGPVEFEKHYFHASKLLAVGLTGVAAMLVALAHPLLAYWISPEIAVNSAATMAILTLGLLISSYVTLPYIAILVGSASPEVCPRIFAIAFVVHVLCSIALVKVAGIIGVAIAVLLAFTVTFGLASRWVSKNLLKTSSSYFYFKHCFFVAWITALFVGVTSYLILRPLLHNLWTTLAAFVVGYVVYLVGCGMFAYTAKERSYAREIGCRVIGLRTNPGCI